MPNKDTYIHTYITNLKHYLAIPNTNLAVSDSFVFDLF